MSSWHTYLEHVAVPVDAGMAGTPIARIRVWMGAIPSDASSFHVDKSSIDAYIHSHTQTKSL